MPRVAPFSSILPAPVADRQASQACAPAPAPTAAGEASPSTPVPANAGCRIPEVDGRAVAQHTPITIGRPYSGEVRAQEYLTESGTLIRATTNRDYVPKTAVRRVIPHDRPLYDYLTRTDPGGVANYDGGVAQHPQHVERMDHAQVATGILAHFDAHPELSRELDITDLRRLSPQQAVGLVDRMTRALLSYASAAWEQSSPMSFTAAALARQQQLDAQPLEAMFAPGSAGLCRTYAEVAQGLFMVLKELQTPATSRLVNSFAKIQDGFQHNWLALYTIQPDGSVLVTQIDPTWEDTRGDGTDYTFFTDEIRDYFRMRTLLDATGNRPLVTLLARLGMSDWPVDASEIVSIDNLGPIGGLGGLSDAIDALPAPSRVGAFLLLDTDLRDQLQTYRRWRLKGALSDHHPRTNG